MKQMIAFLVDVLLSPWYALFGPSVEVGQVWEATPFPIFNWQTLTVVVMGVEANWVEFSFGLRSGISPVRHTRRVFSFRRFFRLRARAGMGPLTGFAIVRITPTREEVLGIFDSREKAERVCAPFRERSWTRWLPVERTLTIRPLGGEKGTDR